MSFMFCRHDPNTMAWSAKEILAGVALTMLTGNIISTACSHGAPPVNAKPELEGELLRYTFKGSGPVAHCLGVDSIPLSLLATWLGRQHSTWGPFLQGSTSTSLQMGTGEMLRTRREPKRHAGARCGNDTQGHTEQEFHVLHLNMSDGMFHGPPV